MPSLPPRTVAVIGAVCLTVGWLLASVLTPPVARLQTLPERQPRASAPVADAGFTEQLHFRLQHAPEPPTPRRNPFTFGERRRAVATPAEVPQASATGATEALPTPVTTGPVFSLAGIAVTGESRTAILAEGQAVHVVKAGERVGGYEIVEVTDNSITLAESSGVRYVLRLR